MRKQIIWCPGSLRRASGPPLNIFFNFLDSDPDPLTNLNNDTIKIQNISYNFGYSVTIVEVYIALKAALLLQCFLNLTLLPTALWFLNAVKHFLAILSISYFLPLVFVYLRMCGRRRGFHFLQVWKNWSGSLSSLQFLTPLVTLTFYFNI